MLARELLTRLTRLARGEDSARWRTKSEGWGRSSTLAAPWTALERRIVTSIDPPAIWRVPQQQTVLLKCQLVVAPGAGVQSGIFRWEVQAGVGSGAVVYIFDAVALQQISLPAEALRISLFADRVNDAPIDAAALSVNYSVLIGDGTTATGAARYTQFFSLAPATGSLDLAIPNGATAYRVAGLPGGPSDPFGATAWAGTRIWTPSTSGAARFTAARSASRKAPPARCTASAMRAPSRSR